MEVVSADSNGVVGNHPQQPELGATWQIHFKMACVFLPRYPCFLCSANFLQSYVTNFLTPCWCQGAQGFGTVWKENGGLGMRVREIDGSERPGRRVSKELKASM